MSEKQEYTIFSLFGLKPWTLQDYLTIIPSVAIIFSMVATNSYFVTLSNKILSTLTLSDYISMSVGYIFPIGLVVAAGIIILGFYRYVTSFFYNIIGGFRLFVRRQFHNMKNLQFRRSSTLPNDGSTAKSFTDLDGQEKARVRNIAGTDFYTWRWRTYWQFIVAIFWIGLSYTGLSILIRMPIYPFNFLVVLYLFLLMLLFIGFLGLLIVQMIDGRPEIDGRIAHYPSELGDLIDDEGDRNKIIDGFLAWRGERREKLERWSLILSLLAASLAAGVVYGWAKAIENYAEALIHIGASQETASGADPGVEVTAPNEKSFYGSEIIRVIDHGILAFDDDFEHVLFVNDHGFIKVQFDLSHGGKENIQNIQICIEDRIPLLKIFAWPRLDWRSEETGKRSCRTLGEAIKIQQQKKSENALSDT